MLEQHGVKSSLPSGHLRDIAALPEQDRVAAAKEALEDGGSKRAFRKAAQKAKEKRSQSVSNAKPSPLFAVILKAEKGLDGTISFNSEVTGDPSAEVKARFETFCKDVKSLFADEGSTSG